jgi:hypothetical protein
MTVPAVSWGEALGSYTLAATLPPLPSDPLRATAGVSVRSIWRSDRCGALRISSRAN